MDGVALCARFSLATNRLDYCGPRDAAPRLYRAIVDGADLSLARRDLERFEALYPYLEALGVKHGLDPFDARVVEAYWIGNELLDAFGPSDFRALLASLVRRGLPKRTAERLEVHLPEHPIPHHAFHVSFVGVGEVTGHVPTTLANVERCRPTPARVVGVRADSTELVVESRPLRLHGGELGLGDVQETTVRFDPRILPDVASGDRVALHWSHPALLLSGRQAEALERCTTEAMDAANGAIAGLGLGRAPGASG